MKKSKYYTRFRHRGIDFKREVEGYKIDSNCFVYKNKCKLWMMIDFKSGLCVCVGDTQTGCILSYNGYYKQKTFEYLANNARWYDVMCEEFENLPVHTLEEVDAMEIKEEPKDYEDL